MQMFERVLIVLNLVMSDGDWITFPLHVRSPPGQDIEYSARVVSSVEKSRFRNHVEIFENHVIN